MAVVSPKNELNNQIATKLARTIDQNGHRTFSTMTKPSLFPKDSNTENEFLALTQTKEVKYNLGWHLFSFSPRFFWVSTFRSSVLHFAINWNVRQLRSISTQIHLKLLL